MKNLSTFRFRFYDIFGNLRIKIDSSTGPIILAVTSTTGLTAAATAVFGTRRLKLGLDSSDPDESELWLRLRLLLELLCRLDLLHLLWLARIVLRAFVSWASSVTSRLWLLVFLSYFSLYVLLLLRYLVWAYHRLGGIGSLYRYEFLLSSLLCHSWCTFHNFCHWSWRWILLVGRTRFLGMILIVLLLWRRCMSTYLFCSHFSNRSECNHKKLRRYPCILDWSWGRANLPCIN